MAQTVNLWSLWKRRDFTAMEALPSEDFMICPWRLLSLLQFYKEVGPVTVVSVSMKINVTIFRKNIYPLFKQFWRYVTITFLIRDLSWKFKNNSRSLSSQLWDDFSWFDSHLYLIIFISISLHFQILVSTIMIHAHKN